MDSCEAAHDKPLLVSSGMLLNNHFANLLLTCKQRRLVLTLPLHVQYEAGWGKKLTYVVAIGNTGLVDVTHRYTRQYAEVGR
jgi:hypothetical protein